MIGTRDIDDLIKKERLQKEQLRKAYIQAENASKAKTNFLNNMSHDIRTPMNVILGYNQLMKKSFQILFWWIIKRRSSSRGIYYFPLLMMY